MEHHVRYKGAVSMEYCNVVLLVAFVVCVRAHVCMCVYVCVYTCICTYVFSLLYVAEPTALATAGQLVHWLPIHLVLSVAM